MPTRTDGEQLPTLLTQHDNDSQISFTAIVSGTLAVNARGCFEVDHSLLVAPYGSTVSPDPLGVHIPGFGVLLVGQSFTGSGGWFDWEPDDERTRPSVATPSTKGYLRLNGPPGLTTDPDAFAVPRTKQRVVRPLP